LVTAGYGGSVNRRWLWWLLVPIVAIAAWIVAPFVRTAGPGAAGPTALAGQPETVLALTDDRGLPVSLAGYRGQIVVMNLWASWCPPCRAEMPELEQFYTRNAARGVAVIGVNQGESSQRAAAFARSLGISFPIWIDEDQRYGRIYAALGLPTTVAIDRDGTVMSGFDGPVTTADLQRLVAQRIRTH
jgi:cytochrome c biogenesis protein CcmG, thiol:disulfide interchange protein DsbE